VTPGERQILCIILVNTPVTHMTCRMTFTCWPHQKPAQWWMLWPCPWPRQFLDSYMEPAELKITN